MNKEQAEALLKLMADLYQIIELENSKINAAQQAQGEDIESPLESVK